MERRELGIKGEKLAITFLEDSGYKILDLNYRCLLGEIDIIAWHKGELVFIEVKTRSSLLYGGAVQAISKAKQKRMYNLAAFYLQEKKLKNVACRFDVVAIQTDKNFQAQEIELITQAY